MPLYGGHQNAGFLIRYKQHLVGKTWVRCSSTSLSSSCSTYTPLSFFFWEFNYHSILFGQGPVRWLFLVHLIHKKCLRTRCLTLTSLSVTSSLSFSHFPSSGSRKMSKNIGNEIPQQRLRFQACLLSIIFSFYSDSLGYPCCLISCSSLRCYFICWESGYFSEESTCPHGWCIFLENVDTEKHFVFNSMCMKTIPG